MPETPTRRTAAALPRSEMNMNDRGRALEELVGKRIVGVVLAEKVTEGEAWPSAQLFLLFSDGDHYEFYTGEGRIWPTKHLWPGGAAGVRRQIPRDFRIVFHGTAPSSRPRRWLAAIRRALGKPVW